MCYICIHNDFSLMMKHNQCLTPEEALDWLVRVATADGLLSPNEQAMIHEFASMYGVNVGEILEMVNQTLPEGKPEVEMIDYRKKNGLLFEKLMVSFLKDGNTFKLLAWTSDKCVNGIYDPANLNPDIHVRQVVNGIMVDYYIECKWHHFWQRDEHGYFYELKSEQLQRYRRFQRNNKRVVFVAYAYGRTGGNPRGIYLVPLHAFRHCRLQKAVADRKYRIEQSAEAFGRYTAHYFATLFAKKKT